VPARRPTIHIHQTLAVLKPAADDDCLVARVIKVRPGAATVLKLDLGAFAIERFRIR
jgi:hypothetical protein